MPAVVRDRRVRHLDTLKSISRALYNMDAAEVEAWDAKQQQLQWQMEVDRAQIEREFRRPAPSTIYVAGNKYRSDSF